MCLLVLDGIFIVAVQVPVILSVLSNSYGEERANNKTWLQNDSAEFPRSAPAPGTVLGGAGCAPFPLVSGMVSSTSW